MGFSNSFVKGSFSQNFRMTFSGYLCLYVYECVLKKPDDPILPAFPLCLWLTRDIVVVHRSQFGASDPERAELLSFRSPTKSLWTVNYLDLWMI